MKTLITYEDLVEWHMCYHEAEDHSMCDKIKALSPKTPLEVLDLEGFTAEDRLWLLLRREIIPERELHLLACDFAEHVLPIWEEWVAKHKLSDDIDPKALGEAIRIKRLWVDGKATHEELEAARVAARVAARAAAVARAKWEAEWMARAKWEAEWMAAARAELTAERKWQLEQVRKVL